ncbi:LysR family transcriptional regulator [Pseudooceanicola sediminis]|uniref:LysR family transcriptional regulator n=1 Tax=Pseudooceanicola sediminis TaxID=2211117 RepID=A0A399J0K8_9RHOB|nr:LysR family transcriptional regulator [Pseudooceanicola sediminis]KAA2315090.1 LysR family transcriptional regulator [Puniceibacterium sp. HSS470]RII38905.1 LysR family transcriptional regulator [Pseudooceanicola sediminis]|tara:strand:+ start:36719 stop:37651 length:933 start_codon:yes stop_codon:yes gene_type:complete
MDKLRAMELFVSAAEQGSFSAAGRQHGISPASVTRRIDELEGQLGVSLMHRSTRALALTENGERYLQDARDILDSVRAADTAAADRQDRPHGLLRVHSRTMFGVSVLSRLQPAFSDAYPDLLVDLHLSESHARMREDGYDLDFRITPPTEAGLVRRRLFLSRRILVAAPDYLARYGTPKVPSELKRHQCLGYWISNEPVYWRFRLAEGEMEMTMSCAFISNNGLVLLNMALAGRGIALLDDYTVADQLASGRLVQLMPDVRVTNSTFEEGVFVAYRESSYVPTKLRVYIDFVVRNWSDALRKGERASAPP